MSTKLQVSEKAMVETAKALGIGEVLPEAYRDLLQPAARELGHNLHLVARGVSAALTPLAGTVWGLERLRDWIAVALTRKLARVEPEKIIAPKVSIAGPVLTSLRFVAEEEELREMYANLLASAMNADLAEAVHPAFSSVIQQLSSDEALILRRIDQCLLAAEAQRYGHWGLSASWTESSSGESIEELFQALCREAGVRSPHQSTPYLENLLRLRVLREDLYSNAKFVPDSHHGEAHIEEGSSQEIYVTEFGKALLRCCVREGESGDSERPDPQQSGE